MATLKYTFEQWWSINGRPEWDSTTARASWNATIESAEALKPSHNSVRDAIAVLKDVHFRIGTGEIKMGCLHGLAHDIAVVAQQHP